MPGKVQGERLGDLLIRKGLISAEQLDQAVQCQVIFGGRLGTNLLELGHLGEEELSEALGQKCRVPAVPREELEEIPSRVIALVPPELARRCQAVPLRLVGHVLHTAMLDPADPAPLKVLASATGKAIGPAVALEVYLRWALDRYYGIKREARFINLERTLALSREMAAQPVPSGLSFGARLTPAAQAKPLGPGDTFWAGSQNIPLFAVDPLLPDPQSITQMEGAPKSLDDFWERVGRTSHPHHLLPMVFRQLEQARDRDAIAEIILDFGQRILPRVALFFIKAGLVFGWDGRGERLSREQVSGIMIPLDRPSLFRTVVETAAVSLGPVPDSPFNRRFLAAIGNPRSAVAVLIPVSLAERVVTILYGDMGWSNLPVPDLTDLHAVLAEAQKAFSRLIVQSRAGS
jgi:hypothetical protein